jgi:hypothetical protein
MENGQGVNLCVRTREGWQRQPFAPDTSGRKSYSGQPDPQGHAQNSNKKSHFLGVAFFLYKLSYFLEST